MKVITKNYTIECTLEEFEALRNYGLFGCNGTVEAPSVQAPAMYRGNGDGEVLYCVSRGMVRIAAGLPGFGGKAAAVAESMLRGAILGSVVVGGKPFGGGYLKRREDGKLVRVDSMSLPKEIKDADRLKKRDFGLTGGQVAVLRKCAAEVARIVE